MQILGYFYKDSKEMLTFLVIAINILWDPIRMYILPTDGGGRIPNVLIIVAIILNKDIFPLNNVLKSHAFKIWCFIICYSVINTLCKGYLVLKDDVSFFSGMRQDYIRPFLILIVVLLGLYINRTGCLLLLLLSMLLYVMWGYLNPISIGSRQLSGLGNKIPLTAVACSFIAVTLWLKKKLNNISLLLIVLFCLIVIFLSGTRKAFGALVIIAIFGFFNKIEKLSVSKIIELLLFMVFIYLGLSYVIEHSLIGERIVASAEHKHVELVHNESINHFLNILFGDRAIQYKQGFELFWHNPITGVGINNYNYYIGGGAPRLHTEYMVHLVENGLSGFCMLVMYYVRIFSDLHKKRIAFGLPIGIYHGGIIAVLFINLTAWTYNMMYVMVIYAIVLDYIYNNSSDYENCDL